MTYDEVKRLAMALDNVEESTSYGTPALKVRGNLMARLRPELDALVVRIGFAEREALIQSDPETYYVTDHYVEHPWVLVHLGRVRRTAMRTLLERAWASACERKPRRRTS
jgi:hypothetical protein